MELVDLVNTCKAVFYNVGVSPWCIFQNTTEKHPGFQSLRTPFFSLYNVGKKSSWCFRNTTDPIFQRYKVWNPWCFFFQNTTDMEKHPRYKKRPYRTFMTVITLWTLDSGPHYCNSSQWYRLAQYSGKIALKFLIVQF